MPWHLARRMATRQTILFVTQLWNQETYYMPNSLSESESSRAILTVAQYRTGTYTVKNTPQTKELVGGRASCISLHREVDLTCFEFLGSVTSLNQKTVVEAVSFERTMVSQVRSSKEQCDTAEVDETEPW